MRLLLPSHHSMIAVGLAKTSRFAQKKGRILQGIQHMFAPKELWKLEV
jgi:hypothetical protein